MCGCPERLGQQVWAGGVKSTCLDATDNPDLQCLVCGSRPGRVFGFMRVQEKRKPIVIGIFKSKCDVCVHPAFQHVDGVLARLCHDGRRRFYQGFKALLSETREDFIFVPEMPVYSRWRIADLLGQMAQRKAFVTLMDKAGACRLEDERPDFRLVSRAKLNDIHVNDDHGSEQCSHCQATMLIGPVHMFDLIRRRDRRSLPRSLNGMSRLTL